jgi:hypothetical protein
MNVPVLDGIAIRRNCLWLAFLFPLMISSALGQALPAGWTDADIGSPGLAGSAAYTNGGWTVAGGGTDIYGTSDKFNFASTSISGDATIIAKVTSLQNSDPATGWSKVGVMFRNDNTAGSANVSVVATWSQGVSMQWRTTAGGTTSTFSPGGVTVPVWLKLTRTNSSFSGYYSTNNGATWVFLKTQSVTMNNGVLAGIDVTAHNNSALNVGTLTNVSVAAVVITNPVVANLPASPVLATAATLNGQVVNPGVSTPYVKFYYGTTDGSSNAASWANSVTIGQTNGTFSSIITGLSTNTTYYFTVFATNNAGSTWAAPSGTFKTLAADPFATPVSVLTYHYDNTRQAQNTNETLLTTGNVNTNGFGKLFTYALDGYVYAEPLIMTNLAIPGKGVHNVVFVATEHDSIYALDADSNQGTNAGVLWKVNVGTSATSSGAPFGGRFNGGTGYTDIVPEVGITGTPVIDPQTGTLYVDAFTKDVVSGVTSYNHRIHALDVNTGAERPYSPVIVAGSVPGTGVGSVGGVQTFSAIQHGARPALCLANGLLVIAYASYADTDPYHGWVFTYNATNLNQLGVFNTTPNATVANFGANAAEGGIWQGGGGICVDSSNNLYFETGNGSFSANTNGGDYSDTIMKLSTTNGLTVADYFTPFDQATLAQQDTDLGSCGPLLLPDSVGSVAHPHLLVGVGKSGKIYLVDRDNMGHWQSGSDSQIVQSFQGINGSWSPPAYWNNLLFFQASSSAMKAFSVSNGAINQTPVATASASVGSLNGSPVISANGANNGIAWVLNNNSGSSGASGTLYAFDALNISHMLWSSSQMGTRDSTGPLTKMSTLTVAGGKVYVGGQYTLSVYGLASFLTPPVINPNGGVFTNSVMVTISNTAAAGSIYYTVDGSTPTTNSTLYTGPFVINATTKVQAIVGGPSYVSSAVVSANFLSSLSLPPPPWQTSDIGTVGLAGSAAYSNSVFIVSGSGADIWNNADGFRYVYLPLTNGMDISARVTSQGNTDPWAKAGVMIRDTLAAGSAYGMMMITPGNNFNFQSRATNGIAAAGQVTGTALNAAPNNWVRLTQSNNVFNAYESADGVNWAAVGGPTTLAFTNTFYYVGLAVSAHNNNSLSTATFDNVTVNGFSYNNPPPAVVLTGPVTNSAYTAAASVTMTADAAALYDSITEVDFYVNSTLVGSATNIPYSVTATGLAAGGYSLTAVAISSGGLMSTSAPVNIVVNSGSGQPYGLTSRGTSAPYLNMPNTYLGSLPTLLSQTGVFTNTPGMMPGTGLIPYLPNVPLWSDGAAKIRYMSVPNNGGAPTADQQINFTPTGAWTFPAGTVFVKTFELNTDTSNTNILRRLETRLLVRDINGAVYGVTYKWRPDNSDADLLSSSLYEDIAITNASGVSTQSWYYPSPSDCLSCHTPVANYVLGLSTRQLNGLENYTTTGVTDNQLRTLNRLGLFNPAFDETTVSNYEALSPLGNLAAPLQDRVRSYLDANCAQCHQPGGTGITFDARFSTPLASQNLINGGLDGNGMAMIVPKDIWRSEIRQRMDTTNAVIRMPPIARQLIDSNAVSVLEDWINSLPGTPAQAPPTITPNGGQFYGQVNIGLTAADNNASIYYTLDGSAPTTNSLLYANAFNLVSNAVVTASAYRTGYVNSMSSAATFFVNQLKFTSQSFSNGMFQVQFMTVPGSNYVLQVSSNMVNWTPIATNPATTNMLLFTDPNASNYPNRFYRFQQQ